MAHDGQPADNGRHAEHGATACEYGDTKAGERHSGTAAATTRFANGPTAQTALPASFAPGSLVQSSSGAYGAALQ